MGSFLCCCKIQNEPFQSTLQLDSTNSRNKGFSQSITKSAYKYNYDQLIVIKNRSDNCSSKENHERRPFFRQFTFDELKQELADEWSEKIKIKSKTTKSIKDNRISSKRTNRFEGQPNYKNSSSLTFQNEDSLGSSRSVNSRGEIHRKVEIKTEKTVKSKIFRTPDNRFNISEDNDFSLRQYMQKNLLEKSNEVNFMNAIDIFKISSLTKEQRLPTVENSSYRNEIKRCNYFSDHKDSLKKAFDKIPFKLKVVDIKRFHTPEPFPLKTKYNTDIKPIVKKNSSYRKESDHNIKSASDLFNYRITDKNEQSKTLEHRRLYDFFLTIHNNFKRNIKYCLDLLKNMSNNNVLNERYEDYLYDSSKEEIKVEKICFNKKQFSDVIQIYGSNKDEYVKTSDKEVCVGTLNKSINRNYLENNTFYPFNGSKTVDYKPFLHYRFSDTLTISEDEKVFLQNSLMDFKLEKENVIEHKRSSKIAKIAKQLEDHMLSNNRKNVNPTIEDLIELDKFSLIISEKDVLKRNKRKNTRKKFI